MCMPKVFYPLEADTTIAVGNRVRSFDFHGDHTCYWVGKVVEVLPTKQYRIAVEFQVWDGKRADINYCAEVLPPVNGVQGIFGLTRGVQCMFEGETK